MRARSHAVAAEVEANLREAGRLADLALGRRLESKADYTPSGVERRLRRAAALRDLCRRLRAKR